jgi:hypothetical protein
MYPDSDPNPGPEPENGYETLVPRVHVVDCIERLPLYGTLNSTIYILQIKGCRLGQGNRSILMEFAGSGTVFGIQTITV